MLLEMIEEVLEEQNTSLEYLVHKKLGKKNVDSKKFETNTKKQELKNKVIYYIDTFEREQLANQVLPLLKSNLSDGQEISNIYSADGSTIIGHKIKQGRSIIFKYQIKPTRRINEAEQMESVIARATGNKKSKYDPEFDPNGRKLNRMREAAQSIGLEPLKKLENQKLPADGLYKFYGAKSGTPKTDLIGLKGKPKYSVKKGAGSQFVSAQGPESAALWHIALEKSVTGNKVDTAVTNALETIPQNITRYFADTQYKSVRQLTVARKAEFNRQLGAALFKQIITNLGINAQDFKRQFAYEGLSGEVKFNKGLGTANEVLTWNSSGENAIEPPVKISQFVNNKLGNIKLRVSGRGGKRGGAIRGDILQSKSMQEGFKDVMGAIGLGALQVINPQTAGTAAPPDSADVAAQQASADQSAADDQQAAEQPDEKLAVEDIIKSYQNYYDQEGIVRFLDALIRKKEDKEGEINMRPLYNEILGDEEVEFGDFDVEQSAQRSSLPLEELEGT
jgi:hypothetical protein